MAAEHTLDELMQDYRPHLLDPVYTISSSKLLLEKPLPNELPTVRNNVCRSLAKQVLAQLSLSNTNENIATEEPQQMHG